MTATAPPPAGTGGASGEIRVPGKTRAAAWVCGAACAAVLAGCGTALSREARYTGDLTPQGACGTVGHGTLTVIGQQVAFTPTDGVLLLRGTLAPDGTAHAELTTAGAGHGGDALSGAPAAAPKAGDAKAGEPKAGGHKPFVMTLTAKVAEETVAGSYATPRCTFTVALTRVHPPLF